MKRIFIALFIILPMIAFAQPNYKKGYVVKASGDTLQGFINVKEWGQCPRSIDFKTSKQDAQPLQFTPGNIKSFVIDGMAAYRAYAGDISTNPTDRLDVPDQPDTGKKKDMVFLKQLVTGQYLTLYYHRDEIKSRYFISEVTGQPEELKYYPYGNVPSFIYNGQLTIKVNKLRPGNDKLLSMAGKVKFEQDELEKFVNTFNNNSNIQQAKISSTRFFAGIGFNSTNTKVQYFGLIKDEKHYNSIAPVLNAGIDILPNPIIQQLVFRAAISFSYIKPQYNYPDTNNGVTENSVYTFDQYTVGITPQVIYNFYNTDALKVYIGAGVTANFSAYTNNRYNDAFVTAKTKDAPHKLERFWPSFPFQAGAVFNKRIEGAISFMPYAPFTREGTFYAGNQTISLGLKYLFGKQ